MKTRADKAEELFKQGYNCCQSVFGAFCDVAGMNLNQAVRFASAFGAGFGKLREVCGAVSGMTLVIGCMDGYDNPAEKEGKVALYGTTQQLIGEFTARQGSYVCREMLGLEPGEDLAEPAVRTDDYYASRPCLSAVRDAADIVQRHYGIADIE
ncbi:C-GCAxxG-C-C family protein [Adlercreutzia sp. ZJ141]|uniref:C-GCAxxG-C-C family protein n=1 Tax=Adlercreutzia sp. ZJ141 TaxID=2709406 RepID=UPI0013E9AFAF|nr:C-GCAxxG-C-C family protein [Adlercreutzia sp. ZJ141]